MIRWALQLARAWRARRRAEEQRRAARDLDDIRTEAGTKARWELNLSEQAKRARERRRSK